MKYRCLIAEDDAIERDMLEMLLQQMDQLELVATCSNGMEAAQYLMKEEVDIVFSDIDMPQLSGLALLKSLRNPPVFIFISSYKNHAAESFDLDVVDFVVKPVLPERLLRAVTKAIDFIEAKKSAKKDEEHSSDKDGMNSFVIRTSDGLVKLKTDEVAYVESVGNFSKIYTTTNGSFHMVLVNLKNLEMQVPACIIRVHKGFMVNLHNIKSVKGDNLLIEGGYEIRMGPAYFTQTIEAFTGNKIITRRAEDSDS